MMYVIHRGSFPKRSKVTHTNISTISVAFGFVLMMVLDVALG